MTQNYMRLKLACYTTNISMAIIGSLSPLLFVSFRSIYGISYSLLGLLVLINFCTQLGIDLIFSFFSHKFNISKTVRIMPALTVIGLIIFAFSPVLFQDSVYIGFVAGTLLFSMAGGLGEVLISPIIAAIPSKNPEREMSKLHSIYAWGVVAVVIISTLFLYLFSSERWQYLALAFAIIPFISFILFLGSEIPDMDSSEKVSGILPLLKAPGFWLCIAAIFFGGASECIMGQWSSSYIEKALDIPKLIGDIFGVALFAATLGLGRTLYAKYGKNIEKILLLGAIGATLCYIIAALSSLSFIGLLACVFTGFCVSMLWPGNLIVASERFKTGGVFLYAMMAAGGDLGASIGPQLVGIITDKVISSPTAISLAQKAGLSPEQLGMKAGILMGAIFPLAAIFIFYMLLKKKKSKKGRLS